MLIQKSINSLLILNVHHSSFVIFEGCNYLGILYIPLEPISTPQLLANYKKIWQKELSIVKKGRIVKKYISWKANYLHALNLQFHMVLTRGFAIFSFFPTVSIASVSYFFSWIQEHGPTLRSCKREKKGRPGLTRRMIKWPH